MELSPEVTSYTMDMLKCGSTYNAKIQAKNKISIGPPSEVLTATTRGGRKYRLAIIKSYSDIRQDTHPLTNHTSRSPKY